MYYVATSWDETGRSPSQAEVDNGIKNLQSSPGAHAHNITIWQPHLASTNLVKRLWQWIEHYGKCNVDYSSMPLADKQVWWLITPEPKHYEDDTVFTSHEYILSRQDIVNQIKNAPLMWQSIGIETWKCVHRGIYPRIYMQVQSLMNYMQDQYSYFPIHLNTVSLFPREFNHEFGMYFNNIPVLPQVMSTYFSTPKTVKHHKVKRKLLYSDNKSLTRFETYEADTPPLMMPDTYRFDKDNNNLGELLSYEECEKLYYLNKTNRPIIDFSQLNFNLTDDIV
jgi:hypothetical protein